MREASANLGETHTEQSPPHLISRFVLKSSSNLLVEDKNLSANLYFRTLLICAIFSQVLYILIHIAEE